MRKHGLALILIAVVLWPAAAAADQTQPLSRKDAADQTRFDQLRSDGFAALYNLDYENARRSFRELARLYPDHPAGPQFLAATLWTETLNRSRRLQSGLYSSDSFFASTGDKVDPAIVQEFRELTKAAMQLARARLKRNQRDVEALYFLGATEGLKAAFEAAVERRFIASLRDGSDSVDHHRDVLKLSPDFHDAELTVGLYDYIVGSLPLPVKLLASITGAHGSKKRGIETLKQVAGEGRWARDDAKSLLIVLLKREERFEEALALSRQLSESYPRNYLFKIETADALASLARRDREANLPADADRKEHEAFGIFDGLIKERLERASPAASGQDLIHFRYAACLLEAGQYGPAAREFFAAAAAPRAESTLVTMAHLNAGHALDLAGRRAEAMTEYRAVLARPDVEGAHDLARKGMREPYRPPTRERNATG